MLKAELRFRYQPKHRSSCSGLHLPNTLDADRQFMSFSKEVCRDIQKDLSLCSQFFLEIAMLHGYYPQSPLNIATRYNSGDEIVENIFCLNAV